MQCDCGLSSFHGRKGQPAPGIAVRGVKAGGFVKGREGLSIAKLVNEILAMRKEKVRIVGVGFDKEDVEAVRAGCVTSLGHDIGQHAGDCGVARMSIVELLQ